MLKRIIQVGLAGMNQDVINPKVNTLYAYEIKNFRINSTGHSNGIELTSEKGTLEIPIHLGNYKYAKEQYVYGIDNALEQILDNPYDQLEEQLDRSGNITVIAGQVIGHCVLNDYLTVFFHRTNSQSLNRDFILRLEIVENDNDDIDSDVMFEAMLLYKGTLGFDEDHKIECIPCLESVDIQKIYWIDGKNYPRVINIMNDYTGFGRQEDPFSFYQEINDGSYNIIDVEKTYVGGLFYAGVVQYAISFYNKNAQETPIVYTTPLNYVSHSDRGEAPNKLLGCAFNLTVKINQEDKKKFEYIRVYSIYRSSIDGQPVVKVIKDIRCDSLSRYPLTGAIEYYQVSFTDTNEQGYDFDAYRILINSDHIVPNAIALKDQKLFLGNYSTNSALVADDSLIDPSGVEWKVTNRHKTQYKNGGVIDYYNHYNQNQNNSNDIKTFKFGEYYKLGLLFQDKYGNWSSVYPVGTFVNTLHPLFSGNNVSLPYALSKQKLKDIVESLGDKDYIKARPVVSFPTISERKILCQGIINPTVFNITERYDGTCFSQASWFFRPYPFEATLNQTLIEFGDEYFVFGNSTFNTESDFIAYITPIAIHNIEIGRCQEVNDITDQYEQQGYDFEIDQYSTYVNDAVISSLPNQSNQGYYTYDVDVEMRVTINFWFNDGIPFLKSCDVTIHGNELNNLLGSVFYYKKEYTSSTVQALLSFQGNDHYINYDGGSSKKDGAVCLFRHYEPLFGSTDIGGEIQGMYFDDSDREVEDSIRPKKSAYELDVDDDLLAYKNYFYVDQQTCTLNSPEFDFNENIQNVDLSQYKVRIVGFIPFWSNCGGYDIIAESPLFKKDKLVDGSGYMRGVKPASGFYDYTWKQYGGFHTDWCAGSQQVSAMSVWFDDVNGLYTSSAPFFPNSFNWNSDSKEVGYYSYPWNKEYLNNYGANTTIDTQGSTGYEDIDSSKILRKVLANTKYADHTIYFDYDENNQEFNEYDVDTDYLNLFKFENTTTQLFSNNNFSYRGNADTLLTYTSDFKINFKDANGDAIYPEDDSYLTLSGYPITTSHYTYPAPEGSDDITRLSIVTGSPNTMASVMYRHGYLSLNVNSTQPIMMRYSSGKHAVFKIKNGNNGVQNILPVKQGSSYQMSDLTLSNSLIWERASQITNSIHQDYIPVNTYTQNQTLDNNDRICGYLWLGELYKDGDSPYQNNDWQDYKDRTWLPCGKIYDLSDNINEHVMWTEGDTFFQRYDCLKTYPYSNEDYQSVVEIASFMVETHVNLDGRYDLNRGLTENSHVNPANFNLINPVYSQANNFFQYNVLDKEDFKTTDFPTRFTWSLNKINGQEIDEWTRTNTSAFYDVDGDKGELTSLRRFNGQIYAFQDKGISRIKYNENVAINTNNGTPIELANSLSVNGVEYISELVGSQNKWSNISTPNGIFFTDGYVAGLYRLGGGDRVLTNLTKNVLQRWFESNNTNHDFIDTASYDANMNEVHFMFDNQSLAYNNDFGTFSSFYDYKGWIGNIKNHSFDITGNSIYFLREGNKYNSFYGTKKSYWISFVANSNVDGYSPSDAIYDNVWYKADVLHSTKNDNFNYDELIQNTDDVIPDFSKDTGWYETFNKIVVGNDYQYAENKNQTKNFDFIKKFRTWRVPVPRQDRTRMRNSWLRIRLENTKPSYDKMVLRDIYVDSFF